MKTSLESSSLYMMLATVPLLPTMDNGLAQPAVFLTTAWCLAAAFGGWLLLQRWKKSSHGQQAAL